MKSTGVVRQTDRLGRVAIPKELRTTLGISEKDPLEIFLDEEQIILKKYKVGMECQISGEVSEDNFILANGKLILSPESARALLQELQDYVDD